MPSRSRTHWDVLDQLSTFVGKLDTDGTLQAVNRHALAAADLVASDMIGRKFWDCYWWQVDDRTPVRLKAAFERAMAGEHVRYDATVQIAGGHKITIDFQMVPVAGADGEIDHVIPSGQDITDRLRAEQQSRMANNILDSLFQSAPLGIAIHNNDHTFFRVNERLADINGLEAHAHTGKHPTELFKGMLDDDQLFTVWNDQVLGRGETVHMDMVARTPTSNAPRHFSVNYFPVDMGDGNQGIGAFVEDVTERSHAARERDRAKAKLDALFRAAPIGMSLHDHELRWTHINQHLADINGKPAQEHIGKRLEEVLPDMGDGDGVRAAFHTVLAGDADHVELHIESYDPFNRGNPRHLDSTFFPVRDQNEIVGAGVIVADVSDRVRAERDRELLLREMNHRIKNTIATVQAIARQTLRNSTDPDMFEKVFNGRLSAMAAANDAILNRDGSSVLLSALVQAQAGPYGGSEATNLTMTGPDIEVSDALAHSLSLVLHELATNAAKYGAWSDAAGRVDVSWSVESDGLDLTWHESGGPPVEVPDHRGFGTRLIETTLRNHDGGAAHIDYRPEGVCVSIRMAMTNQFALAGE